MVIKDQKKEEFNKKLPCEACAYKCICKYAGRIPPIETPEMFDVVYICREKKKIEEAMHAEK